MEVPRYWREAKSRYILQGTKCRRCNNIYFGKRSVCPMCKSQSIGKMEEFVFSGMGKVYSYTCIYEGLSGFEMQVPYIIAIIRLDEGVNVTAQIVDVDCSQVHIGMEVKAIFRKIGEDGKSGIIYYGYKFSPEIAKYHRDAEAQT